MTSNRWPLVTLTALFWLYCPTELLAAADEYHLAGRVAEAQSVPTHSDYQLKIGPRIDYSLRDLYFVNGMVGYAVGTGLRRGQAPIVYKTTDGGERWLPRLLGMGCHPRVIAFADENRGLVTFHDTTGCPEACEHRTAALVTADAGATWRRVDYPELQGHIIDVVFDHAGNAFGLLFQLDIDYGTSNPPRPTITLLRSEDSGQSWQRIGDLPPQAETPPTLALRHHQGQLYLTWADASILVFDTEGHLLETLETGYARLQDLVVVSESTLLATGTDGATNALIRSIDGGRTWNVLLDEYARIAFARSRDDFGVIVSRGTASGPNRHSRDVIAHTRDGGSTWRESDPILSLSMSMKRRVRQPGIERDLLLLNDRIVEIEHTDPRPQP